MRRIFKIKMNALEFNNVWKKFRRGESTGSLRDMIPNVLKCLTDSQANGGADAFWALKDVSFKVKKGEVLGIIGPNGAGKTTVLNMLAGIMKPNKGGIKVNGKVSALIAVGAGFHPDLTGRENIYLNGSIMGINKREIAKKFDSIVDFAGAGLPDFERFIDTPIKRYSSRMYVRLGFAIAAHIEPDILLIDEVLAVGDMAFQEKCYSRIKQLKQDKKTIVFLSHNLAAVENLCDRAICLHEGRIKYSGKPCDVITAYINYHYTQKDNGKVNFGNRQGTGEIRIQKIELINAGKEIVGDFKVGEKLGIRIFYQANEKVLKPNFGLSIWTDSGIRLSTIATKAWGLEISSIENTGLIECTIPQLNLLPGRYSIRAAVAADQGGYYDFINIAKRFNVIAADLFKTNTVIDNSWGIVYLPVEWRIFPHVRS